MPEELNFTERKQLNTLTKKKKKIGSKYFWFHLGIEAFTISIEDIVTADVIPHLKKFIKEVEKYAREHKIDLSKSKGFFDD